MRSWERTERERESRVLWPRAWGWALRVSAQCGCFGVCMLFALTWLAFMAEWRLLFSLHSARAVSVRMFFALNCSLSLSHPSLSVRSGPGAWPKEGNRAPGKTTTGGRKKKIIKAMVKQTGNESTRKATFQKDRPGLGSQNRGWEAKAEVGVHHQ